METLDFDGFRTLIDLDINFYCFKQRRSISGKNKIMGMDNIYIYKYESRTNSYGTVYIRYKYAISLNKWDNRIKSCSFKKPEIIWNWLKRSKIKELRTGEGDDSLIFKLDYEDT